MRYKKGKNYDKCPNPEMFIGYNKHTAILRGEIIEVTQINPYMNRFLINLDKPIKKKGSKDGTSN